MIVVLPALAIAAAAFAAASLRLASPVATLLALYVLLVAGVGAATWVLSPLHAVTRSGLLGAELVLLGAAVAAWSARGRPRPPPEAVPSFALPQFVAELAILVAVYGASRRLGFDRRAAARGAAVLATFSAVALQSTTAQNDLVAASFPAAAVCFLLAGAEVEEVLAGVALGLGVGTKLTTVLVWPVLAWLAWLGGRRVVTRALAGVAGGLLTVGIWSFVLNLAHTGHPLGHGQGRVEEAVSPSAVTVPHTFARVTYRMLDLGLLWNEQIWGLAAAGLAAAAVYAIATRGVTEPALVGIALASPLLVLGAAPASGGSRRASTCRRRTRSTASASGGRRTRTSRPSARSAPPPSSACRSRRSCATAPTAAGSRARSRSPATCSCSGCTRSTTSG